MERRRHSLTSGGSEGQKSKDANMWGDSFVDLNWYRSDVSEDATNMWIERATADWRGDNKSEKRRSGDEL